MGRMGSTGGIVPFGSGTPRPVHPVRAVRSAGPQPAAASRRNEERDGATRPRPASVLTSRERRANGVRAGYMLYDGTVALSETTKSMNMPLGPCPGTPQ